MLRRHVAPQVSADMAAELKAPNWTDPDLMLPILNQILFTGQEAFLTKLANRKPNETTGDEGESYDQKETWMNADTGIITLLKKLTVFKDIKWPQEPHVAVLQAVNRFVDANKDRFTPGREQAERAPAGTEGTKDETFTSVHQAVVAVAELRDAAQATAERNKAANEGRAEERGKGAQFHQDQAARRKYGSTAADIM